VKEGSEGGKGDWKLDSMPDAVYLLPGGTFQVEILLTIVFIISNIVALVFLPRIESRLIALF
jgi:hypothetical protein